MAYLYAFSTKSFLLHTWGSDIYYVAWDGSQFTVSEAIPAALYDPMMPSPTCIRGRRVRVRHAAPT